MEWWVRCRWRCVAIAVSAASCLLLEYCGAHLGFGARRGTAAGIPGMPASSDGGSPATCSSSLPASLEAGAGAIDCNAVVVGLMREQLAGLARAALAVVLEAGGRATSVMIHNIGRLLEELGTRPEAEPLSREYLKACRDKFGALGEWTLRAVDDLAALLRAKGKVAEAETLMREAVEGRRKKFGPRHEKTLVAISNLAGLLHEVGQQAECERLMREVVDAKRKELGESHEQTLSAMNDLATQLYGWGMLAEAERLQEDYRQDIEHRSNSIVP